MFKNYSYSIGSCAKKISEETITEKYKYECTIDTTP